MTNRIEKAQADDMCAVVKPENWVAMKVPTRIPVAWAVFAPNGNIRLWSQNSDSVRAFADSNGLPVTPLFATAANWAAHQGVRTDFGPEEMAAGQKAELAACQEYTEDSSLILECEQAADTLDAMGSPVGATKVRTLLAEVKRLRTAALAGWKLVPVEPTPEMLAVAGPGSYWLAKAKKDYAAMLAAAPSAPAQAALTGNQLLQVDPSGNDAA